MIGVRLGVIVGMIIGLAQGVPSLSASERKILITSDTELKDNGFLKFLLPRFSLKNSIRTVVADNPDAGAHVWLTAAREPAPGRRAAFTDGRRTYFVSIAERASSNKYAARFAEWLLSDIGQRAVASFRIDGRQVYAGAVVEEAEEAGGDLSGNAAKGEELSLRLCGRCHVVGSKNRLAGIGSTPSFALLKTLPNWEDRFATFYVLNPHPSFTQIDDVTPPFDPSRPPPINPLTMAPEDVDNILAFVAGIAPADLGAPIKHQ